MFNKKTLLRFYLIGLPVVMIWAYIVTNPSTENNYEDSPVQITGMNSIAQKNYEESRAAYMASQAEEARSMFWPIVGAGVVWIGIAYVVFLIIYRMIKSKK